MRLWIARTMVLLALSMPMAASAAGPAAKLNAKPAAAAPKANWLSVSRRSPEGAIQIGNPAAKVKLVEYLSLTCPHCAALSASAMQPLQRDYIAKGLVSFEVRHAVRDGFDFVASLLLRCEPRSRYLGSIEALFASAPVWMGKAADASSAPGFDALSPDQKQAAVAKAADFQQFFAKRGMNAASFAACMADKEAKDQLAQMAGNSWQRDSIPGTPLIVINGVRQENVHAWADLEPLLKAALK